MSAQVFVMGLEPGVASPGFRLGSIRSRGRRGFGATADDWASYTGADAAAVAAGNARADATAAENTRKFDEMMAALDQQIQAADPKSRAGTEAAARLAKGTSGAVDVIERAAGDTGGGGAMNFLSAGIGDFVKNIFGQGAAAGSQFTSSIAALQQGEAAREQARMLKLVGGGLLAVAVIGGGIFAISRLSKR